ncbi:MAG: glycosyltransferase family 39 protein [Anaerolinea sp.]|nr:glycosyltransferase family 39 protein [Anaerolinea sp.]
MKFRLTWLLTIPTLLLLYFVLLRTVPVMQLHQDEYLVYYFTRYDLAYTVNYLASQDVHPPLWFGAFDQWRTVAGDSEFAGRYLSILFSTITLAMVYRLGRDWFGTARAGLATMILLGLSAYFLSFALEIRPYAAVMLLSSVSMWLFARWLARRTWRLAVAYGVVCSIMFYVHYFLVFLVAAQVIYFLLFVRRPARVWRQALGAALTGLIVWSPWLPSFLNQVKILREVSVESGMAYGTELGTPATTQATNLTTISRLITLSTNGQIALFAGLLIVGAVLLWRQSRYRLAVLWALGVPAVALLVNFVAAVYTPRYVSYLTIGLALVMAAAVVALPRIRRVPLWIPVLAVCAVALGVNVADHLPDNIAYRDIFRAMDIHDGDVVYFDHAGEADMGFLGWQMDLYLHPGYRVISDHQLTDAQSARRVWYITGNWFDDDVRAVFDELEHTHPVQTVLGQCDRAWCYLSQLMEAPPLTEPIRFGDQMLFWGADVDSVSRTSIEARLWWRVGQAPDRDYSIGLHLLSEDGRLVAQSDGAIQHYGLETVQTSSLEAGRIYIDHRTLSLPPDLTDGIYTLRLVVYQSWDNERLMVGENDSYTIDTITLQ